ncbi:MAG: Fe2+-dependent dioxygenase [Chromatiales bacterium]|nr:Fe2+-dependent dioxygenase [Chromatiales bacterium]
MLNKIVHLLSSDDLSAINELLKRAHFVDGRLSAGKYAKQNKHNQEVSSDDAILKQLNAIIMPRLVAHPDYRAIALPNKIAEPYYAMYRVGDYYGDHTDNPVMGNSPYLYRSDIAMTVFLNNPDEYDGGELLIGTLAGDYTQRIKYPAGDAVLYPATTTHCVAPVTRGYRIVAITWIQSLIPNPQHRMLLYRLNKIQNRISTTAPDSAEVKELEWIYTNLFRMWTQV